MDGPRHAISDQVREAVAPVTEGLFPEMPVDKVVLVVQAWTTIVGVISLETFGHWRNTILDPEAFFEVTIRDLGDSNRAGLREQPLSAAAPAMPRFAPGSVPAGPRR